MIREVSRSPSILIKLVHGTFYLQHFGTGTSTIYLTFFSVLAYSFIVLPCYWGHPCSAYLQNPFIESIYLFIFMGNVVNSVYMGAYE